jgi:hypothetical protein
MTSLTLVANGYTCKYFLQRMTRGVSPKELDAFMVQVRYYTHCTDTCMLLATVCSGA